MLEKDARHLTVGLIAELLVHAESGSRPQIVESGISPVVHGRARREETPHHSVGITERRCGVGPPRALEALLPRLLRPHRHLDHLDFAVDADVPPHGHDGLGHRLRVGDVAVDGFDDDFVAFVSDLLEPLPGEAGIVSQGRPSIVVMTIALRDRTVRNDPPSVPELFDDGVAVDREGQRLLHQRIVERRPLGVDAQDDQPREQDVLDLRAGVPGYLVRVVGRKIEDDVDLALEERGDARRRLGNRSKDDPVDVRLPAPIVPGRLKDEPVVLHPRYEPQGSTADRPGVELLGADRRIVLPGDDLASVERKARGKQGVRLLGVDVDDEGIGSLDPIHGREDGPDHRELEVGIVRPLDAELDVGRRERVAIVERDTPAQLELPQGRIHKLPLGSERWMQLAVVVSAHEVIEEIEGDGDVGGGRGQVRVEVRDVAALGDDQLRLPGGLRRRRPREQGLGDEAASDQTGRPREQRPPRDVHARHDSASQPTCPVCARAPMRFRMSRTARRLVRLWTSREGRTSTKSRPTTFPLAATARNKLVAS